MSTQNQNTLCGAIASKQLVEFMYEGGKRRVEPHMVAYNEAGHLSLSGWFVMGYSKSQEPAGWREYLLTGITGLTVLQDVFAGARPGYNPSGGKKFPRVVCKL